MKKYSKLATAVLLSCATMLAPFHAEAAHTTSFQLKDEGRTLSIYIGDNTNPFVNFMVYSAESTGNSKVYRDFFTEGNGINVLNEQQAIANGLAYVKDLLGNPIETPTIRLFLEAEVYNNAAAGSDTMDNGNTALGNYFILKDGVPEEYRFNYAIDAKGEEHVNADTCVWIWPRNTGWDGTDVGNLSRNIDTQSMSSVMVHELFHALGMNFNQYRFLTQEGGIGYKIGVDDDADYANKFTLNSYDIYGKKAQVGDEIVYINAAEKDKYHSEDGKFYMYLSNGYDAEGNAMHTYDSGCYFIGNHVRDVLTINDSLANLTFPVDSKITVPGLPLNGDEGYPELSHIELQNSFLSHQYFRNWSVPMEAELAMMEDLGYTLDRRNFFGFSVYNDGLTITNDNGYFKRNAAGTDYLVGEANKQDWGVGLHVYGQKNNITQTGNLLADGDYAIGIRLDGTQDNVLNLQSAVTANGKGGNGIAVTWGRNHTVNIESDSSVKATGDGGVALRFDFGHNDIGDDVPSTEIVGSYIYYKNFRHTAYDIIIPSSNLLTALDGPLVKECNIDGDIEGSTAAIYISKNALVKEININDGASIKGDIVSEWNPQGMWFSESDPVFLNNFMPEGEDGLTSLNFNTNLLFNNNILGQNSLEVNINSGKLTLNGIAKVRKFTVNQGAILGGNSEITVYKTFNDTTKSFDIADGQFCNQGTIAPGNSIGTIKINGDFVNDGYIDAEFKADGTSDKIIVDGSATINGTINLIPTESYFNGESSIKIIDSTSEDDAQIADNADYKLSNTSLTVDFALEKGNDKTEYIFKASRAANAYSSLADGEVNKGIGKALDLNANSATGETKNLIGAIDFAGTTRDDINKAYAKLNPSIYNSSSQAILATHNMLNNLMSTNMGSFSYHERPAVRTGGGRGPLTDSTAAKNGAGCIAAADAGSGVVQATPQPNQWRNIVIPFSSYTDQHNGTHAYTNHNSGMLGALERTLDNGLTMGYHAAINHQSTSGSGASIKGEGLYLGTHASYAPAIWQGWEAFASVRLGVEDLRSHRNVSIGGYSGSADADWTGFSGNLRIGGALTKEHGAVQSGPFASLDYSFAHRPSINEKGGAISTALASETYDSLRTQLGYRLSTKAKPVSSYDSTQWQSHASVAWNHELLSDNGSNSYSLMDLPGVNITDKTADYGRDSLGIMAGVTFKTPKKLDVTLSLGSDMYRLGGHSIYGKANFEWKF